jgi:sterol desaturase/sphingolipid hydroxylase (fatty acid hydroxylase superfamily)
MKLDLITLAVPLFFAGIIVEVVANWLLKQDNYVLGDALGSLGCGVLDQLCISVTRAALFTGPYIWLYEHAAPWHFEEPTIPVLVGGLLLADFGYYWGHRWSHEINVLWAGHVVHHSSEQYNLSTALRQNWWASWYLYLFNMPLAAVGVSPLVAAIIIPFIQLYQFWIHTRMIPKLGPFELIFNTPSHHRVHHGINPEYVDKNYGAILIIWDKLFGTFEEERASVVYGVLKPLESWDPFKAWTSPWRDLFNSKSWRCWFKPPGWDPDTGKKPDIPAQFALVSKTRFKPRLGTGVSWVAFIWFTTVLLISATYLFYVPQMGTMLAAGYSFILAGLLSWYGMWIDRRCVIANVSAP